MGILNVFEVYRRERLKNPRAGFGLIEALVGVSVAIISMYGIISLLQVQSRETRSLEERLAALDLEKSIISSLTNFSVCSFMINHGGGHTLTVANIGTATPPVLTISKVFAGSTPASLVLAETGQPVSPYVRSLIPLSIKIENILRTGLADTYSGDLMIQYDNARLVRPLKPTRVRVSLRTTGAVDPHPVNGCTGGATMSTGLFCNTWNEDPPGPNIHGCAAPDSGFCHIPNSENAAQCVISAMDDDTSAYSYPFTSNGRTYTSVKVPASHASLKCQISPDPAGGFRYKAYHNCGMVNCVYTCLFL